MSEATAAFRAKQIGFLPDHLGLDWIDLRRGFAHGRFEIEKKHLAPNGYLHAAAVVGVADTACGYGCVVSLPEGAANFTTAELKAKLADLKAARKKKQAELEQAQGELRQILTVHQEATAITFGLL